MLALEVMLNQPMNKYLWHLWHDLGSSLHQNYDHTARDQHWIAGARKLKLHYCTWLISEHRRTRAHMTNHDRLQTQTWKELPQTTQTHHAVCCLMSVVHKFERNWFVQSRDGVKATQITALSTRDSLPCSRATWVHNLNQPMIPMITSGPDPWRTLGLTSFF